MRRKKLCHLLIGAAIAIVVVVPLCGFTFVKSGMFNVGATSPHTKFTTWLTHETMIQSVERHAHHVSSPASFTAAQVTAGFCAYETHCVACHGAAGIARQQWVSGMEPQPPYLLDVTKQFQPRELFWIVRNGIKMTGMPSWRNAMSDEQTWDVVAWLEASSQLPPQTYIRWRRAGRCRPRVQIAPGAPNER
ncbi:MAG TPA: cytochrome c [Sphingomicrobium sp.]|nr:cytochrome c [Sphingomicrobium sp.]